MGELFGGWAGLIKKNIHTTWFVLKGGLGHYLFCLHLDETKESLLRRLAVVAVYVHQMALYRFQACPADCTELFFSVNI